jgi:hypothetical protein
MKSSISRLHWRQQGASRIRVFAGDGILNPLSLFLAPRGEGPRAGGWPTEPLSLGWRLRRGV